MTSDDPRPIGESLAHVTRDLGIARPAESKSLVGQWPALVGDALAEHTRPAHLRQGTLTIEVDDGAWGAPLKYLGDTLIARANDVLGGPLVTAIRVVVRPPGNRSGALPETPPSRPSPSRD